MAKRDTVRLKICRYKIKASFYKCLNNKPAAVPHLSSISTVDKPSRFIDIFCHSTSVVLRCNADALFADPIKYHRVRI